MGRRIDAAVRILLVIKCWSWESRSGQVARHVKQTGPRSAAHPHSADPFPSFLFRSPWLPPPSRRLLLVQVTSPTSSPLRPRPPSTQAMKPSSNPFKPPSVLTARISGSTPPTLLWSILSSHWRIQMITVPKNTRSVVIKTHPHPPPLLNHPCLPTPMSWLLGFIS